MGGTLWAVAFDPDHLAVTKTPVPVLERVETGTGGEVNFGLSDSGSVFYAEAGRVRTLVWVNRDGQEEPLLDHLPAIYERPRVSPDGTKVAVDVNDAGNLDIWVYGVSVATRTRLTSGPATDIGPAWSPDGERVVFWSDRDEPGL